MRQRHPLRRASTSMTAGLPTAKPCRSTPRSGDQDACGCTLEDGKVSAGDGSIWAGLSLRPPGISRSKLDCDRLCQPAGALCTGRSFSSPASRMGNPHAVIFCDDVEDLPLEDIGPLFENHEKFPDRINTEFIELVDRQTLKMRVWERGSGETFACGTGACAAVGRGGCQRALRRRRPRSPCSLRGGELKITLPGGLYRPDGGPRRPRLRRRDGNRSIKRLKNARYADARRAFLISQQE